MKQPDRFERIAFNKFNKYDSATAMTVRVEYKDIAKLLRAEHRWMVNMVHKVWDWQGEQLADNEDACQVILDQLAKRRT